MHRVYESTEIKHLVEETIGMVKIIEFITKLNRPVYISELHTEGFHKRQIQSALKARSIIRIRRGWYAHPDLDPLLIQATRVGGVLCGPSAAQYHGLWVPDFESLWVSVPANASGLRSPLNGQLSLNDHLMKHPDTVKLFWDARSLEPGYFAESLPTALWKVVRFCEPSFAFVVLESALKQRKISRDQVRQIIARLPALERTLMLRATAQSDSGSESMLKFALLKSGIPFRQQISVAGVGRVDFLLENRLVVEVDSEQFHQNQYRDRKRDQALTHQGYRSLRFVYPQIVYELSQTIATIREEYLRLSGIPTGIAG